MQDANPEKKTTYKLTEYAKQLLALPNDKRPRGRRQGWTRTGSVLAGKMQTEWEMVITSSTLDANKNRWARLFAKPLNRWTPTLPTSTTRSSKASRKAS